MKKLLLIDDDDSFRKLLIHNLKNLDLSFVEAADSTQAIEAVTKYKNQLALIIIDMVLPEMDGFELFTRLNKISPNIPAIMATAHGSTHLAVEFMKSGGADFIEKPIDFDILQIKIDQVFEKQELEARNLQERSEKQAVMLASRLKDEFLSSINHEFRTPLHGILSCSKLGLQRTGNAPEEKITEYFTIINQSGNQLMRLLNEFFTLADMELGNMTYVFSYTNIEELIKSVIEEFTSNPDERHEIELTCPNPAPKVQLDKRQMMHVIRNLISNAVKFSPPSEKITIEIYENNGIIISVKDRGIGIPAGELETIFEKFKTSQNAKAKAGVGLGLAIAKQIVTDHKGSIKAHNTPDGYTQISINLPQTAQ